MTYDFDMIVPRRGTGSYKWDTPEEENVLILRQSVTATLIFSSLLAVTGITISDMLPSWLVGDADYGCHGSFDILDIELCFRGTIFLVRLWGSNWIYKLRIKR